MEKQPGPIRRFIFTLLSVFTWIEIIIGFLVFICFQFILFLATVLFDRKRTLLSYHSSFISAVVLFLSPVLRVRITGRENLDRSRAHILVMNHQSLLDIVLAFRLFYPIKMIGKKVLAKVPVIGWNMMMSGHLMVDRADRKSQFNAIRRLDDMLRDGNSILVFPEGTRTRDGNIGEFRKGAFRSAISSRAPLLPVVLDGAYQALPKGSLIAYRIYTLTITVLPPVEVKDDDTMSTLSERCRGLMIEQLERGRGLSGSDRPV